MFCHASARRSRGRSAFRPTCEHLEDRLAPATLPAGFTEIQLADGLLVPTAMAVAPDGRIFVSEQHGTLRVIIGGRLQAEPVLTLAVNSETDGGLLGITFDPNFDSNHYFYVYYTASTTPVHNRVSRFTAGEKGIVP